MGKGRKRKTSVVNTTFGREGVKATPKVFFIPASDHQRERSRDEPEAPAPDGARKEDSPGDDEAERGSVRGKARGRRSGRGKLSATTIKRPTPKSTTTTKHPSPSFKPATSRRGHPGRRPEAGVRHSCENPETENPAWRSATARIAAGHDGELCAINR